MKPKKKAIPIISKNPQELSFLFDQLECLIKDKNNHKFEGFLIEEKALNFYLKDIEDEKNKNKDIIKPKNFSKTFRTNYKNLKKFRLINPNNCKEIYNALNNGVKFNFLDKNIIQTIQKIADLRLNINTNIIFNLTDRLMALSFNDSKEKLQFKREKIISKSNLIEYIKDNEIQNNNSNQIQNLNNEDNKRIFSEENIDLSIEYLLKYYKFDSLSCINCGSESELDIIDYNFNKINYISYYCTNGCGRFKLTIDEYLEKFKDKTYLNELCFSCKKPQYKKLEDDKRNLYLYCLNCKKSYCPECVKKSFCQYHYHIKIDERNDKCSEHIFNNDDLILYKYCLTHKKKLCQKCLLEHSNHDIYNLEKIKPIKIINESEINEEIEIYNNIINFFENKITEEKNICNKRINDIEKKYNDQIKLECSNNETNQNINKINEINQVNDNFVKIENQIKEQFSTDFNGNIKNNLQEYIKKVYQELSQVNEIYKNDLEINKKYDSVIGMFSNIKNLNESYLNNIETIKLNNDKSLTENKKTNSMKIDQINKKYNDIINEFNNKCLTNYNKISKEEINKQRKFTESKIQFYRTYINISKLIYNIYDNHKNNYYNIEVIYKFIMEEIINKFNDNEILKQKINEKKLKSNYSKLKDEFPYPPLIKFKETLEQKYILPILQCICNIPDLIEFFKYKNFSKKIKANDVNDKPISYSIMDIIEYLWPSSNLDYSLYDFSKVLNNIKNANNQNTNTFLITIIYKLHEELNNTPKNDIFEINSINDLSHKDKVLENYINIFKNENMSLISGIFFATNYNYIQCPYCKTSKYKFNDYIKSIHEKISKINLYECFEYKRRFQNIEICDICNNEIKYPTILFTCPKILIIFLKRKEDNNKKYEFDFDENLNLRKYIERFDTGFEYELISFINMINEEYIAYFTNPINCCWYEYKNNEIISKEKLNDIDKSNSIVLFYQKK